MMTSKAGGESMEGARVDKHLWITTDLNSLRKVLQGLPTPMVDERTTGVTAARGTSLYLT